MTEPTRPLVLDLLEWIAARPRSYAEVMDAWRSSCPRLTIWEDALAEGLVACSQLDGVGSFVRITASGRALLASEGRLAAAVPAVE
ncbi:MAG: hypothetical protein ACREDZ_14680 [Kiloniellales bacterium]